MGKDCRPPYSQQVVVTGPGPQNHLPHLACLSAWPSLCGKALSDLTLFFAPFLAQALFTIGTTNLFDLYKYCLKTQFYKVIYLAWDRCVGKFSLTLSCFPSFQCFGHVGIRYPILCTTHVLRIQNKTWWVSLPWTHCCTGYKSLAFLVIGKTFDVDCIVKNFVLWSFAIHGLAF